LKKPLCDEERFGGGGGGVVRGMFHINKSERFFLLFLHHISSENFNQRFFRRSEKFAGGEIGAQPINRPRGQTSEMCLLQRTPQFSEGSTSSLLTHSCQYWYQSCFFDGDGGAPGQQTQTGPSTRSPDPAPIPHNTKVEVMTAHVTNRADKEQGPLWAGGSTAVGRSCASSSGARGRERERERGRK